MIDSFIFTNQGRSVINAIDVLTETRYYGHFYVIFMFELHEKSYHSKAESRLPEDGILFTWDVLYLYT